MNYRQLELLDELGFDVDNKRTIIRNMCQCSLCKDIIESKTRHDFVQCACKGIYADGGRVYIRRGFTDPTDVIELSVFSFYICDVPSLPVGGGCCEKCRGLVRQGLP